MPGAREVLGALAASADGTLSFAAADRRLVDAATKAGLRVEAFPSA
jgi:hypothetical protein